MNTSNTEITGMIAVHDDAALNARLDYSINIATNKVTYTITCWWKRRRVFRQVSVPGLLGRKAHLRRAPRRSEARGD